MGFEDRLNANRERLASDVRATQTARDAEVARLRELAEESRTAATALLPELQDAVQVLGRLLRDIGSDTLKRLSGDIPSGKLGWYGVGFQRGHTSGRGRKRVEVKEGWWVGAIWVPAAQGDVEVKVPACPPATPGKENPSPSEGRRISIEEFVRGGYWEWTRDSVDWGAPRNYSLTASKEITSFLDIVARYVAEIERRL